MTGYDVEPELRPRRPGDPARIVGAVDRIAADLDWHARYDLEDMVTSAWTAWQHQLEAHGGAPVRRRATGHRARLPVPGLFVTLEGIDRSGKSTQAAMLADALGDGAVAVREPGGTAAGERVRDILKDPGVELGAEAEALLFAAARAELVRQVIRPALDAGRTVVCDRFLDSSLAYQGVARDLGPDRCAASTRPPWATWCPT